jgi:hypothetical protein
MLHIYTYFCVDQLQPITRLSSEAYNHQLQTLPREQKYLRISLGRQIIVKLPYIQNLEEILFREL